MEQVVEALAVGRPDQLDTALGDGAGGQGFQFAPNFVDHDHFRVVVFNRLDHDLVLLGRDFDLHPARTPNRRVRHVAISADFVGSIDYHDPPRFGKDAGGFTQQGGLAHPRPAQNKDGLTAFDHILDNIDCTVDRAPNPQGQPDDCAAPVANGRDTMEGALDAGAVVRVKIAQAFHRPGNFIRANFGLAQGDFAIRKAGSGNTPKAHDDFEQFIVMIDFVNGLDDVFRQDI